MKKSFSRLILILGIISCFVGPAVVSGSAQDAEPREPVLHLGPRIGVTWALSEIGEFDAVIQEIYPSDRQYFPLYSQIGLSIQERIGLGDSGWRITFEELVTVEGLDQNFALPVFALLMGLQAPFGLQLSLGPEINVINVDGDLGIRPSLVYVLGWSFSLGGVSLPVSITFDPLPHDRKIRLSLSLGIDFGIKLSLPERKDPFNY